MLRFGTCSWKYREWEGIVYRSSNEKNYLKEYSSEFDTVEIDQWFWSLFDGKRPLLPQKQVAEEYSESVPKDFLFTVKVPNSITLTHYYQKNKTEELKTNPFFLNTGLYEEFLKSIDPLIEKLGLLIFQFEYLNKKKIKNFAQFQDKFYQFYRSVQSFTPQIAIELRNANFLKEEYFNFLTELKISPVLLQGYYMPPITETIKNMKTNIKSPVVIRLHGPDRKGMELISNNKWNKIYVKREEEISKLADLIRSLQSMQTDLFVNVNNHFEGCAPLTIRRIKKQLNSV